MSPAWLRLMCLCVALLAAASLPLAASDDTHDEIDLTLAERGDSFTNSIGMRFVRIKAGTFLMGAPNGDNEASGTEKPQHEVEITKEFYLGVYEVTQKQYKQVMGTNPSHFCSDGPGNALVKGMDTSDFPVERIAWNDTQDFLKKLQALPGERGRRYRLPTEAEWEYASRAGAKTRFHCGDNLTPKDANYQGTVNRTCKVGSYKPNAFGLYDMHGNVFEWCQDWYSGNLYTEKKRLDPTGPSNGSGRCIRGGAWLNATRYCRSSQRGTNNLTYRGSNNGFRVACSVRPD